MSQQPPTDPHQQFNIDDASIADSQIGGQAGHDLTQNHGSGAIYKDVTINNYSDRRHPKKNRLSRQEYRNRQILLNKVKNYWIGGVLEKSLHNRVLIELGLEERPNAVTHPWNLVDEEQKPLPQGTKAINLFDKLGDGRTLLILGEPGSGKTTTLLELTSDLIARAEQDTDHLIPVVLNLSSWAGRKQTIANWLVEELNAKYQVPQKMGQTWVNEQQLLLLFDGLDEVQAGYREACIVALNAFHQDYNPEIVVCSRIKDYQVLSNRLNFQRAVCLKSLTLDQVRHYLDRVGSELAGLRELLEENIALQELSQSPLMLNIMALAYQGVAAQDLPQMALVDEYRQQLFKDYIKRMFQRRNTNQEYKQKQVMYWLIWLAQRMVQQSQTVFLIERMQPNWLKQEQMMIYHNGNILFPGLIVALIVGLIIGPIAGLCTNLHIGSITVLTVGLMLIAGLIPGRFIWMGGGRIKTVESLTWSWREAINKINNCQKICKNIGAIIGKHLGRLLLIFLGLWIFICIFILFFDQDNLYAIITILLLIFSPILLAVPFFIWQLQPNIGGFFSICAELGGLLGGVIGTFFGLIIVPISGLRGAEIETKTTPNQGIWRSAMNAVIGGVISGLIFGLTTGVISGLIFGLIGKPIWGLIIGLSVGLIVGLIFCLISGKACIQHFILRLILYRDGYIPWNYARFLDYAAERIFLQKVGGGYIFIHRLLLEHFAQMELEIELR
jgi:hypothetical protein